MGRRRRYYQGPYLTQYDEQLTKRVVLRCRWCDWKLTEWDVQRELADFITREGVKHGLLHHPEKYTKYERERLKKIWLKLK